MKGRTSAARAQHGAHWRDRRGPNGASAERAHKPDEAVSSVVAAVLLFALFTTVFVLYSVQTLPEWIGENEQEHQNEVRQHIAGLKAGLDGLSARKDAGPVSSVVQLGPPTVPLLQTTPVGASLSYEPGFAATATFDNAALHLVDGAAAGAADADVNGATLSDIQALTALQLKLQSTGVRNSNDLAWVQVTATDGTNTVSLRLDHAGKGYLPSVGCDETDLRVSVVATTTTDRLLQCGMGDSLPGNTVDALDPDLGFAAAVAGLTPPLSITLTDGGQGGGNGIGSYAAVWVDTEGIDQVAGAGSATTYSITQNGGRLVYAPAYQQFPQQLLSWEGGAIVAAQDDQQVVSGDPSFQLTVDGTVGTLRWTLVQLAGSGHSAGTGEATVQVTHLASSDVLLTATGATFTLTTPEASAWRSFFEDRKLLAGDLTSIEVSGSGNGAVFRLLDTGPVLEWRVHLRVIQATVVVT